MEVKRGSRRVVGAQATKGWHSRGYLPHLDVPHVIQFVTFRLADSVPDELIGRWRQELRLTSGQDEVSVALQRRVERYADAGHGACHLRDPVLACMVRDALLHFDGRRYRLLAWCVMPNHVHVLVELIREGWSLRSIVHSWKSYTAIRANPRLGRMGEFWQRDYFDRYIRDDTHLRACIAYVRQNPVKAGLAATPEGWPWCGVAEWFERSD